MIIQNICLSDIPAGSRFKGKDGKIYTNIIVTELREKDKFDNTHTVYMSQSKEDREAKAEKVYIGRGKEVVYNNGGTPPANTTQPAQSVTPATDGDTLPF